MKGATRRDSSERSRIARRRRRLPKRSTATSSGGWLQMPSPNFSFFQSPGFASFGRRRSGRSRRRRSLPGKRRRKRTGLPSMWRSSPVSVTTGRLAVPSGQGHVAPQVEDLPGVVVVDDAARGDDELVEARRQDVLEEGEVPRELPEGAEGGPRDLLVAALAVALRRLAQEAVDDAERVGLRVEGEGAPGAPRPLVRRRDERDLAHHLAARLGSERGDADPLAPQRARAARRAAPRAPGGSRGRARPRRPRGRVLPLGRGARGGRPSPARGGGRAGSSEGGKASRSARDERRRTGPRQRVGVGERLRGAAGTSRRRGRRGGAPRRSRARGAPLRPSARAARRGGRPSPRRRARGRR